MACQKNLSICQEQLLIFRRKVKTLDGRVNANEDSTDTANGNEKR